MKKIFLASVFFLPLLWGLPAFAGEPLDTLKNSELAATLLLKTSVTTIGQPIQYPKTDSEEVTAMRVVIPPGKETGWHSHPFPVYGYILAGTLTLETEGGGKFQFQKGQAIVEVVNALHNGINRGEDPVEILAFFMGEKGRANTLKGP